MSRELYSVVSLLFLHKMNLPKLVWLRDGLSWVTDVTTLQSDRTGLIFSCPRYFLPASSVPLSYFNLAVPMRGCLGKHSCMSSPFPIAILSLNGLSLFGHQYFFVVKRLLSKTKLQTKQTSSPSLIFICLMDEFVRDTFELWLNLFFSQFCISFVVSLSLYIMKYSENISKTCRPSQPMPTLHITTSQASAFSSQSYCSDANWGLRSSASLIVPLPWQFIYLTMFTQWVGVNKKHPAFLCFPSILTQCVTNLISVLIFYSQCAILTV